MDSSLMIKANSPGELARLLQDFAGAGGLASVTPCGGGRYLAKRGGNGADTARVDDLSDEQSAVRAAVVGAEKNDILVIAGPGSGKTKTLISCIVEAVQAGTPADKVVAISFTNNSAAELKVRLCEVAKQLPALHRVHVSTFHAWVAQLAATRIDPWTFPPVGLNTASLAVALHLRNPDTAKHVFTKAEVAAAERHFEGCETFDAMEKRNFNRIGAEKKNREGFENLKKAASQLEAEMKDYQIGTFGTLMKSGAALAEELKQDSIAWLFIDEAQDLNAPQADFVAALQKRTGCRVFAIADDDQGIYKFRGASSQFLREFGRRKTTQTFQLTRNFRSTKPIVQACVRWITPNWKETKQDPKTLFSERETALPVVVLAASGYDSEVKRGKHAQIILEACKSKKLIDSWGEAAVLDFSVNKNDGDLSASGLKIRTCGDSRLGEDVLNGFLTLCRSRRATGAWHHSLWKDFLRKCTAGQTPPLGHPGLDDLYAALEVIRRLEPNIDSAAAAKAISDINRGRKNDFEKHFFLGARPEPDYQADSINYLTLHSSKGMEFRAVWLVGCGFSFSTKPWEEREGQPNAFQEVFDFIKNTLSGKSAVDQAQEANRLAGQLETRRLLYVGMSRATDLVMISAPRTDVIQKRWKPATKRACEQNNAFRAELDKALDGVPHVVISSDEDADQFAASITAAHRNPSWTPPHRYRVESFTSLTRQPSPGEIREVEIPRDREFPQPQTPEAMIGDLFHRIMHMLCLEPHTLRQRLAGKLADTDLIARVSTRDPATELKRLAELLEKYFSDTANKPWEWLDGARSEVPFSHVTKKSEATEKELPMDEEGTGEEILLKGFLDLVRFNEHGQPVLILDYKTGPAPAPGSPEDLHHAEQLRCYRDALAASYACAPRSIKLKNYYVVTRALTMRPSQVVNFAPKEIAAP